MFGCSYYDDKSNFCLLDLSEGEDCPFMIYYPYKGIFWHCSAVNAPCASGVSQRTEHGRQIFTDV